MNICATPPTLVRQQNPAQPQPQPPSEPSLEDLMSADNFEFDWTSQDRAGGHVFDLPGEAPPRLQKPVLLVHGLNSGPDTWKNMRTWLTRGGQNPDGGVVGPGHGAIDGKGKVFSMQFSRPYNPLANNAAELRQAIDSIRSATGSSEIDIIGHSMGGLDTRLYLDQGDEKVDKLVMLGTPNHGSILADMELTFQGMGLGTMPKDDPLVQQALKDLSDTQGDKNTTLITLNKNWARQTSRASMLIIAGCGKPTLKTRILTTIKGDGVVTQESAAMPDVPVRNLWSADHGEVKEHPDALRMAGAFLAGQPIPSAQEPPDLPQDRDMTPRKVAADGHHVHYWLENSSSQ